MPLLKDATAVKLGTTAVGAVYLGATKVWPTAFVPTQLAGLTLWLDASQLALADGAALASWPDLSGGGHHGNIVGTPGPTVRANALKGQRVIRFSKDQGRVRGVHGVYTGATLSPYNFTLAYITRLWGPNVGRAYSSIYPSSGNVVVGFHSSAQDSCYLEGWISTGTGWTGSPGTWKLYSLTARHDGTTYVPRFFLDGVLKGGPAGGSGSIGSEYALSGYDATGLSETMDCEVAELVMYNRELPDADRQTVEGYLRSKWLV